MDITQIYQAISAVSERVNDLNKRLDDYIQALNQNNQADIDYVAMMTDVEIPDKKEGNLE